MKQPAEIGCSLPITRDGMLFSWIGAQLNCVRKTGCRSPGSLKMFRALFMQLLSESTWAEVPAVRALCKEQSDAGPGAWDFRSRHSAGLWTE